MVQFNEYYFIYGNINNSLVTWLVMLASFWEKWMQTDKWKLHGSSIPGAPEFSKELFNSLSNQESFVLFLKKLMISFLPSLINIFYYKIYLYIHYTKV